MIKKIAEAVLNGHEKMDFWMSNATSNSLLNEAKEIRLTDDGDIELCFEEAKLVVNLKATIYECKNGKRAHAKLLYLETKEKGLAYEINERIKTESKECVIL